MGRRVMKEIDFGDEDAVLAEMSEELPEWDLVIEESHLTSFGSGTVYEVSAGRGTGRREWYVVENEDAEYDLAIEIVKQDLEQEPEIFEQSFIEQHINMSRLKRNLEPDVLDSNIERLRDEAPEDFWREYERAGFEAPEEDEDGDLPEPSEEEIEELAEHQTDEEMKDPMQYLEDMFGREDAVKKAIEIAGIDIDAAAEDAVDTDGAGHFLSSYDGKTHVTKSGLVYWRHN